jgi:hypothetical protein
VSSRSWELHFWFLRCREHVSDIEKQHQMRALGAPGGRSALLKRRLV